MPKEVKTKHDIFSKPLPEILDEIESAAADARKAADEARTAGEKAAEDVMIRLRKLFLTMVKDITTELGDSKK
jgi:flagellar hook-basal body complex protein FliE